jgi:hypothetical protein
MRPMFRRPKALAILSLLLAVPLAGCQGEAPVELEHGLVWLHLLRGQSEADSPYGGTTKVAVTLLYLECLSDFYMANPDYHQGGIKSDLVFGSLEDGGEGWLDRLCENSNPASINCTVDSFEQQLYSTRQLPVVYSITGDLENREVPFGPVPDAELAACEGSGQPIVRVGGGGAVRGLDASGSTIWNTESFDPAEAATGQGAAIGIRASRI